MTKQLTVRETLATLVERVDNLINGNRSEHQQITKDIKGLCDHVNEQHDKYEARLKKLEDDALKNKSMYAGRIQLFKWLSIFLAIASGAMALLHAVGLF